MNYDHVPRDFLKKIIEHSEGNYFIMINVIIIIHYM